MRTARGAGPGGRAGRSVTCAGPVWAGADEILSHYLSLIFADLRGVRGSRLKQKTHTYGNIQHVRETNMTGLGLVLKPGTLKSETGDFLLPEHFLYFVDRVGPLLDALG